MKYDVFLSHASKDKTEFVEELKKSFDKLGISVFYDTDVIDWGDNWKQKILEGLKNCHFGVIVISKNFFDRTWTEKELKALLNRQNEEGEKIILPILYNVSIEEINKKYKKLSDIQFIDSSVLSVKDITICLAKVLLSYKNEEQKSNPTKFQIIKNYCEVRMSSSLEFFDWVKPLIENNSFIKAYGNNSWIGWQHCDYEGKSYPLFQCRNGLFRINPEYLNDFKKYYEKVIKPQI